MIRFVASICSVAGRSVYLRRYEGDRLLILSRTYLNKHASGTSMRAIYPLDSYRLASAAFEEDVVGNNVRGAAVLLQDVKIRWRKVELFVARARPKLSRLMVNDSSRSRPLRRQ